MKLSEAIRLGAMLGEQLRFEFILADGRSCVLGSAALALGIKDKFSNDFIRRFAGFSQLASAPEPGAAQTALANVLFHLNDYQRWTRERIADWIESSGHDFEMVLDEEPSRIAGEPVEVTPCA